MSPWPNTECVVSFSFLMHGTHILPLIIRICRYGVHVPSMDEINKFV
jgi:hypothetical protein